ncbi:SGNH/GDSL hydrolase family protein [Arcanobacterium wilhelmae]|nr:SGNH/GDSL hydrolase family protein [Arcanobacterium wilhelmae]WFN90182.1 SGNH/GDSL hydrolase family protein [Arcanobacterium wilhelmae]
MNLTLLGDSYTAGNGAGEYYQASAYRSGRNWGHEFARILKNEINVDTVITNLAHSGDTTKEVLEYQVPNIPTDTDLVMMTIGGNDTNFKKIVMNCFVPGIQSATGCSSQISDAQSKISEVRANTTKIFEKVADRLKGRKAQLVLVSYPQLSTDVQYNLGSYNAAWHVRNLGNLANKAQAEEVAKWAKNHPKSNLTVKYVDDTAKVFAGHEPNPEFDADNPNRWINEFSEMNGRRFSAGEVNKAYIDSDFTLDLNEWYHPNREGHFQIAKNIAKHFAHWSKAAKAGKLKDYQVPSKRVLGNPDEYSVYLKQAADNSVKAMEAVDAVRGERTNWDALKAAYNRLEY